MGRKRVQKAAETGLDFAPNPELSEPFRRRLPLGFDDGAPDLRLAPLRELARACSVILKTGGRYRFLAYDEAGGDRRLRQTLTPYLHETRGLNLKTENLLITRGSQMALYLISQVLLKPGDLVVTSKPHYPLAAACFRRAGAKVEALSVDGEGLDIAALAALCEHSLPRAVYVTPHCHYPTTVSMSVARRRQLIALAEHHRFAIIEDDYDYDFHYPKRPALPLASHDQSGLVLYIGSFSKVIAPACRVGYVAATPDLIAELEKLRFIIDLQGDRVMERAVSQLLQEGVVQRQLKKALRLYEKRRDLLADLLNARLGNKVEFEVPQGGLALWVRFDPSIDLVRIREKAASRGLYFPNSLDYRAPDWNHNGVRMGFASLNEPQMEQAMDILHRILD